MNDRHYEYVLTVAQEQSFSRAAEKLHISQPSLSQCIRRIEQQYGVALFNRNFNTVTLTAAGQVYLKSGREILEQKERIFRHVQEIKELLHGCLRIGIAPYRDCVFLAPTIKNFKRRYPGIDVILREMNQSRTENALLAGEIDIALTMAPSQSESLDFYPLLYDTLVLAIDPNHWYFKVNDVRIKECNVGYPMIHLEDMAQCNFIFLSADKFLLSIEEKACQNAGFSPKVVLMTKGVESVHAMAAAGLGATFITQSFLRFSKVRKILGYYRLNVKIPEIPLGILRIKNKKLTVPTQKFLEILQHYLGERENGIK